MAAERELFFAEAVGEEAEVADSLKAGGQSVQQEASDKFFGRDGHHFGLLFVFVPVVLPLEDDLFFFVREQALVGDGDFVGVAAKIGQHVLRTSEGWFGVDDPLNVFVRAE